MKIIIRVIYTIFLLGNNQLYSMCKYNHNSILPSEIIEYVLLYNESENLDKIIENIRVCSTVNKYFYSIINSPYFINHAILFLSEKFKYDPISIAIKFNNPLSFAWLRSFLIDSGEYELFKIALKIYQKIFDVIKKFRYLNYIKKIESKGLKIDHSWDRSETNILLSVNDAPEYLITPWGRINVPKASVCIDYFAVLIIQTLLNKLDMAIYYLPESSIFSREQVCWYLVEEDSALELENVKWDLSNNFFNQLYRNIFKNLPAESCEQYINKKAVIVSGSYYFNVLYSVEATKKISDKLAEENKYIKTRDIEVTRKVWIILNKLKQDLI